MEYKTRTKGSRVLFVGAVGGGSDVIIRGCVITVRSGKEVAFIDLNDGSCLNNIQAVVQNPESLPILEKILTGASIRLEGTLVPSGGKGQKYEIAASKIDLAGPADTT